MRATTRPPRVTQNVSPSFSTAVSKAENPLAASVAVISFTASDYLVQSRVATPRNGEQNAGYGPESGPQMLDPNVQQRAGVDHIASHEGTIGSTAPLHSRISFLAATSVGASRWSGGGAGRYRALGGLAASRPDTDVCQDCTSGR